MFFRIATARILLLVYVTFLLTYTQFPFLCVQLDGTMKLRTELKNNCCTETKPFKSFSPEMNSYDVLPNGDSCGSCFDFPSQKNAEIFSKFWGLYKLSWVAFLGGTSPFQGWPSDEGVLFHGYLPPPGGTPIQAIVQSTCLLI